jgi:hypothetical protein
MAGLSTTNLPTGGGMAKTITPGNWSLKINKLEVEEFKYKPAALHLLVHVETEAIDSFEGFWIDKDNESLGKYAGQIGTVKAGQYAFADGVTKSNIVINRDTEMMKFLQNICIALGIKEWFTAQDGLHNTIEEFVDAFNTKADYKNKFINFCIAGKEYMNKGGYPAYDLHLPKYSKSGAAFGAPGTKVLAFTEELIVKSAPKEVDSFEGTAAASIDAIIAETPSSTSEFTL